MPDIKTASNRLLGGLTPRAFLRAHWQKEARLVRQALPECTHELDRRNLVALAARDDVESRIVVRQGARWSVAHGPFRSRDIAALGNSGWTLLVQGVDLHSSTAARLLRRFAFIPYARLDDLMVSYAVTGGGVGPHVDSYDVFLLQGLGRRRWRYGRQRDLALREGLPLKILRRFKPEHDVVLESGDMLYLPPQFAHDGIALDECTTYSIGFREGSAQELANAFLDFLRDRLVLDGRYADPRLAPTRAPARIDASMQRSISAMLEEVHWSRELVREFIGVELTEPKSNVVFDPPRRVLSGAAFRIRIAKRGIALDLRTRMLYDERRVYVNGEAYTFESLNARALRALANDRALSARLCASLDARTIDILHDWYRNGFLAVLD
ncbi:MAG TPA: cupin domain-containing protein [Casimicrobiaceae bacterium]|nr:cupin domain-containing protein [Casimicrobiaceae bacterium]